MDSNQKKMEGAISFLSNLPTFAQNGFIGNPTARATMYSNASNGGNAKAFYDAATKTTFPIEVNVPAKATIVVNGIELPVFGITVTDSNKVSVTHPGGSTEVTLPMSAMSTDSEAGKQSGFFTKNMIENASSIHINPIIQKLSDGSKVIGGISVTDKNGKFGSVEEGLAATAIAAPAFLPYASSYPTSDKKKYVQSPQELNRIYDNSVREGVGTSNAKEITEKMLAGSNKPSTRPRLVTNVELGVNYNDRRRYNKSVRWDEEDEEYIDKQYFFKIGDVPLRIPPTHLTISQLRSSTETSMIGFHSFTSASPTTRITFKINAVFTGAQIDDDLKRIITQFIYCPFNIIHSPDLSAILLAEDASLAEALNDGILPYVPVTMDDYTIYTLENHPDSLGCSMQFSLFNFVPYFDGDTSESFLYTMMKFDENGKGIFDSTTDTTTHLEYAIHPYNFDILDILRDENRKWAGESDAVSTEIDGDPAIARSMVRMHKLTSFQDIDFEIINEQIAESEISFMAEGMSVRYENHFAWFPIGGYSQAIAQYIGPGSSMLSFNAKVNLDDATTLGRLLKTYHESRSKDAGQFYDDRYLVHSSMTKLADCLVASITDIAITSLPNHPGYSDVNIMLRKSPYVNNSLNSTKVAEPDYYWGMQRIIKAVESNPALMKEVETQLGDERAKVFTKYGWLAKWASNAGNLKLLNGIHQTVVDIVNDASSAVENGHSTTPAEKEILNRIKLISGGVVNISELIDDIQAYSKSTAIISSESASYPLNVIMDRIKGSKEDKYNPFWRNFTHKVITRYADIFGVRAGSNTMERSRTLMTKIDQTSSETNKNDIWTSQDALDTIRELYSNIQPSYDFTKRNLQDLRDEAKNKYPPIKYMCEVAEKDGITQEAIYGLFVKLHDLMAKKSVAGLTVDTAEHPESNFQVALLKTADKDAQSISTKIEEAKISKYSQELAEKVLQSTDRIKIRPPFAAHRYYPQVDEFINIDPRISSTIGSYFYSKIIGTDGQFYHMVNKFKMEIEKSVSPAFDFPAWSAIFPENSDAQVLYKKARSANDPFYLMQAIAMPELRKEINSELQQYQQRVGANSRPTPMMDMTIGAIANFSEDEKNLNKPFSGLSDWVFLSKLEGAGKDGSPAVGEVRKNMMARKELTYAALIGKTGKDQNSTEETTKENEFTSFYRYINMGLGVVTQNSGKLLYKSATTPMDTNNIGSEDKGLDAPQVKEYHYNHLLKYMTNVYSVYKDGRYVTPKETPNDTNPTTPAETNIKVESAEEAMAGLRARITAILNDSKTQIQFTDTDRVAGFITRYLGATVYSLETGPDIFTTFDSVILPAIYSAITAFVKTGWGGGRLIYNPDIKTVEYTIDTHYKFTLIEDIFSTDKSNYDKYINTRMGAEKRKNPTPVGQSIFDAMLLQLSLNELHAIIISKDSTKRFTRNYKDVVNLGNDNEKLNLIGNIMSVRNDESLLTLPIPLFSTVKDTPTGQNAFEIFKLKLKSLAKDKNAEPITTAMAASIINEVFTAFMDKSGLDDRMADTRSNPAARGGVAKEVSPGSGSFLISQFMNGMLPTFGLQNAFPTYKVYIIDQNLSDLRFHSLDNWYDFRLIKDMMVIKSKDDPMHLLKCRVIVDERFITTNVMVPQRDFDRNPIEHKAVNPSPDMIGTMQESSFYGGKVPLRVGMRICVKLGYHSDPRLLDTVFIGTISGLQGSMEMNVFDLEAQGDGRELSVPASITSESIKGQNYAEVIAKMLRANSSVFHLGRNYGTTIERFTREHHILYGFSKSVVEGLLSRDKGVASTLLYGAPSGIGMGYLASTVLGMGFVGTTTAVTAGVIGGKVAFNTLKLLQSKHVDLQASREFDEEVKTRSTSDSTNGKWFNFRQFMKGNTFDAAKSTGQIFKHFYDTFKYGNDPVDDNIWAVDIWARFSNLDVWKNAFEIKATNQVTIWQVLQGIKRVYPNYALDVRPYGGRSTLYFGPLNWLMWRTDDPVLAMLSQIDSISNENVINKIGAYFDARNQRDEFMVANSTNSMPPLVEFQKTHMATSDSNIIFNGIQSTPDRGWNAVVVNCGKESYDVMANAELHPGIIRTKVDNVTWTENTAVAQQYALGLLKEGVEKMYGGTLALRGNPKIEPYDRIYIADRINKMNGWIEVETVIHKFDNNFGFTTHITPNLVCAVNSDAYKTNAQIIRSLISSDTTIKAVGSFFGGVAAGGMLSAGLAVAGITIAGPWAIAIGAIASTAFWTVAGLSVATSVRAVGDLLTQSGARGEEADIMELMEAAHKDSLYASSFNHGMWYGFIGGYIRKTYNLGFSGTLQKSKDFKNAISSVLKNSYQHVSQHPWMPFAIGKGGPNALNTINSYSERMAKLTKTESVIKDINKYSATNIDDIKAARDAVKDQLKKLDIKLSAQGMEDAKASLERALEGIEEKVKTLEKIHAEKGSIPGKPPRLVTDTARAGAAPAGRLLRGLFRYSAYSAVLEAVNAIPEYLENYLVSYMAKANCMSISPLWNKNALMTAGLDGWQKTNAFMHMKNMVVHAKRVFDDVDKSVNYSLPTMAWNPPLGNKLQDIVNEKNKRSGVSYDKATKADIQARVLQYASYIDSAIQKCMPRIVSECGRAIFTKELIMGIIDFESKGDPNAIGSAGPGTDTRYSGRGLMQLTGGNQYDNFLKHAPAHIKNKYPKKPSRADLVNIRQDMLLYPELNILGGCEYIVDLINKEVKNHTCNTTNDGTLTERVARAYIAGPDWRDERDKPLGGGYKGTKGQESEKYSRIAGAKINAYKDIKNPKQVVISQPETSDNGTNITKIRPNADTLISAAGGNNSDQVLLGKYLSDIRAKKHQGINYTSNSSASNILPVARVGNVIVAAVSDTLSQNQELNVTSSITLDQRGTKAETLKITSINNGVAEFVGSDGKNQYGSIKFNGIYYEITYSNGNKKSAVISGLVTFN